MPKYEIQRWNPILLEGNNEPFPMIYIKPDDNFFDYIKENNYLFLVTISDTNSVYDNKEIIALADMSAFFPNYRPNFFNETGFYVLTLFSSWNGYPSSNGTILIQGLKGPDSVIPQQKLFQAPTPLEWYEPMKSENDKDEKSLSFKELGLVILVLIIICILVYLFSRNSKKK